MKQLRIHIFMHVPYEGLGCIEQWTAKNNHSLSYSKFFESFTLPEISDIDWLIVMGGPMGVHDEAIYPWLENEKIFINKAIQADKTVLGICLGSQLIAKVLGAKVYPNTQKEIGWFNLKLTKEGINQSMLQRFDNEFPVFHWHGDTFDLPDGSINLFQSEATKNQGFLYKKNVLGLQFHFEVTATTLNEMTKYGSSELIENKTVQSAEKILARAEHIKSNNQKMFNILDYLTQH